MDSNDKVAAKQPLEIHICVPDLEYSAPAELSTALAQAITSEIKASADDLAGYQITRFIVRNATNLSDKDIETIFSALRKSADLTGSYRIVEISPELINTGLMTSLRNFYIDLYRIDLGSLNITEFHSLKRKYDFRMYGNLKMLLDNYGMHNWSAELEIGMPAQSENTLADCLKNVNSFAPGVVCLTPLVVNDDKKEQVCARWAQANEGLLALGYTRINIFEYAKPGYEQGLDTYTGTPSDYWGFGPNAVSLMDGCALINVAANNRYIAACSKDNNAITASAEESSMDPIASVKRLDKPTLMCNQARYSLCGLSGIDPSAFEASYGSGLNAFFQSLCDRDLASNDNGMITLTINGTALSPQIWNELSKAQLDISSSQ